jgi:hypothetical protein
LAGDGLFWVFGRRPISKFKEQRVKEPPLGFTNLKTKPQVNKFNVKYNSLLGKASKKNGTANAKKSPWTSEKVPAPLQPTPRHCFSFFLAPLVHGSALFGRFELRASSCFSWLWLAVGGGLLSAVIGQGDGGYEIHYRLKEERARAV